jgi:hypothetical protein
MAASAPGIRNEKLITRGFLVPVRFRYSRIVSLASLPALLLPGVPKPAGIRSIMSKTLTSWTELSFPGWFF